MTPLLALAALSACVNEPAPAPSPPPLAADANVPALALIEHVLTNHFSGQAIASDPPTTCVELRPDGLSAGEEEALIVRFPRLAPRDRCASDVPPPADEFTGESAVIVQVYDLACSDPAHCTGWASRPGSPASRYTMAFDGAAWRFTGDRRLLAE